MPKMSLQNTKRQAGLFKKKLGKRCRSQKKILPCKQSGQGGSTRSCPEFCAPIASESPKTSTGKRQFWGRQAFGICLCLAVLFSLCACDKEKQQAAAAKPAPTVSVLTATSENIPLVSNYTGQTLGFLSVEVRAQISGILKKRTYQEGDYVQQGQLLFEIDPAQAQAALDQAKGQLAAAQTQYNNAKREWDRIVPLYRRNAVSQKDRDSAQAAFESAAANVESAKAKVSEAQIQLGYTQVTAPISGYTSRETVNEGNLITAGSSSSLLTTINQTDPIYVTFAIPASEMLYLKNMEKAGKAVALSSGAPAHLTLWGGTSYPFAGKVIFLDTQVETQTSVIRAKAQFPNPAGLLLPGQFASISVGGASLVSAMMLPQNAVLQTAKGPMVYVVDKENKAALRPVVLGATFGTEFLLLDGVQAGEKVIVEGTGKVMPDEKVQIVGIATPSRKALPTPGSGPAPGQPGGSAAPLPSQINIPAPLLPSDMNSASPASTSPSSANPASEESKTAKAARP